MNPDDWRVPIPYSVPTPSPEGYVVAAQGPWTRITRAANGQHMPAKGSSALSSDVWGHFVSLLLIFELPGDVGKIISSRPVPAELRFIDAHQGVGQP